MENKIENFNSETQPKQKKKFSYFYIIAIFIILLIIGLAFGLKKPKLVSFSTPGYFGKPIESQKITDETNGTKIKEPVLDMTKKLHYELIGWFKEGSNEPINFETELFKEPVVLHSKFRPIEYTISYDNNLGDLLTNPLTYNIETKEVTFVDPTCETKEFKCWEIGDKRYTSLELTQEFKNVYLKNPTNITIKIIYND